MLLIRSHLTILVAELDASVVLLQVQVVGSLFELNQVAVVVLRARRLSLREVRRVSLVLRGLVSHALSLCAVVMRHNLRHVVVAVLMVIIYDLAAFVTPWFLAYRLRLSLLVRLDLPHVHQLG